MKPNIAEPVTAPATLKTRNVIKTRKANVTLDRRSFGFGGFEDRTTGFGPIVESWYVESWFFGELGG